MLQTLREVLMVQEGTKSSRGVKASGCSLEEMYILLWIYPLPANSLAERDS